MSDPVAFFREVAAAHPRCFWLDGGGAREWSGRRSIIGWLDDDAPSLTYDASRSVVTRHRAGEAEEVGSDVFAVLESEMRPGEQWFGYLGYASRPDLPARPSGSLPDAVWMRASHVRVFEHGDAAGFEARPQAASRLNQRDSVVEVRAERDSVVEVRAERDSVVEARAERDSVVEARAEPDSVVEARAERDSVVEVRAERASKPADPYPTAFARVQEHLHAGNSYEVNLTYREDVEADVDPVSAYLRLRALNPAPYAGFLQHDVPGARAWLLSSSPERYALVTADRVVETKPIKGTTPRGATPEEDVALAERLATDPKTRAENLMIVDLLRNDLSMVCEPGTVEVPALMQVESYESVHQLVSTVRGRLRDGVSTVAALRALFPAGSMTGAPKLRTMEIIDEVEWSPRGVYSGAFGWISGDGPADLGVVIRSLVTAGDGRWQLGTGGGITVRSEAGEEWAETGWKAERLLRALTTP